MRTIVIKVYDPYEYPPREITLEYEPPEGWDELDDDWERRNKCWEIVTQECVLEFEVKGSEA